MRLKRFQVSNYRSIVSARPIDVSNNLTIIGPNNEGKSNLVRALVASLAMLEELTSRGGILSRRLNPEVIATRNYVWSRDCPLHLQDRSDAETIFKLEFELDRSDRDEFALSVGSSINNRLPITIRVGRNLKPTFEVNKQGKGQAALTAKSAQIAEFIGSRLSINYIPAVQTARESARSVERLVSSALRKVEQTPEYKEALATIEELQRPVLAELEARLLTSLETFVPTVRGVSLDLTAGRESQMRSVRIGIDDGRLTPLEDKGDGVISLVGMALLSKIDTLTSGSVNLILVIEEPESHLHPRAIHNVRQILDELGGQVQVMITTHSPSLINRLDLDSNIIVENSQARVAKDIAEIRDVLGVRVADNLTNARLIVICEGKNDRVALERILCDIDPGLSAYFRAGEIEFSPLGGGANLSYSISAIQGLICEAVCLLDDDSAGREALDRARSEGLITVEEAVLTSKLGKIESEFEDLIRPDIVNEYLKRTFALDLSSLPKGLRVQKFSKRAQAAFQKGGLAWNDAVKAKIKHELNELCADQGLSVMDPDHIGPLQTLANIVKAKISKGQVR